MLHVNKFKRMDTKDQYHIPLFQRKHKFLYSLKIYLVSVKYFRYVFAIKHRKIDRSINSFVF